MNSEIKHYMWTVRNMIVTSFASNDGNTIYVLEENKEVFHTARSNEVIDSQEKANEFVGWLEIMRLM